MQLFTPEGHEQVVLAQDAASGLRCIIAIASTALGPALGGTRFFPYADDEAALADALRLSRAMALKNAVAGLPAGGGKAVVLGDPRLDKTEALLLAYGRVVAALGGRYVTACDVGTTVADMDVVARTNPWTTGRSRELGGAGDSGELTALGVHAALRAAIAARLGAASLEDVRVAVSGLGKVGHRLVGHLVTDGAVVLCGDIDAGAVARTRAAYPSVSVLPVDALVTADVDVFSPNALGGALTPAVAAALRARLVCGGANNQLADPAVDRQLADRGVLWCPDVVVNAGGVVAVADEGFGAGGYDDERARERVLRIGDTLRSVLAAAAAAGTTAGAAAVRLGEERIAAAARDTGERL